MELGADSTVGLCYSGKFDLSKAQDFGNFTGTGSFAIKKIFLTIFSRLGWVMLIWAICSISVLSVSVFVTEPNLHPKFSHSGQKHPFWS